MKVFVQAKDAPETKQVLEEVCTEDDALNVIHSELHLNTETSDHQKNLWAGYTDNFRFGQIDDAGNSMVFVKFGPIQTFVLEGIHRIFA